MHKAIEFGISLAAAVVFAALGASAWQLAGVYVEIPAPITPALWLGSAFFWFCALAYAGAAVAVPFRKG